MTLQEINELAHKILDKLAFEGQGLSEEEMVEIVASLIRSALND